MGLYYVNMSAETIQQPDFGGKKEYHQTPLNRLEECQIITDAIDELLHLSPPSSGTTEHDAASDKSGIRIKRAFRYMEADKFFGWPWTPCERLFSIEYINATSEPYTHETYTISVNTFVRQKHVSNVGTQNKYVIEYFGANRESATGIIEQPNLVEPEEAQMVTRPMTPYDQIQLFEEIVALQNAIDAGEHERSIIAQLNATTE